MAARWRYLAIEEMPSAGRVVLLEANRAEDAAGDEGEHHRRRAAALGQGQGQALIVIGRSVAEAFDDLYFLEQACRLQVLAMSTGRPLRQVKDEVAKATFGNLDMAHFAGLHFSALKRLLDRDEPDYAD